MDPVVALQRALDLARYGNHLSAEGRRILERLIRDMMGNVPMERWWMRERAKRIQAIMALWTTDVDRAYAELAALFGRELPELAGAYRATAGKDTGEVVKETPVRDRPEVQGATTDKWLRQQRAATLFQAEAQLRIGAHAGEGRDDLEARITRVVRRREREVATVARTAANRAAAEGYERGMREVGIERYRYVAIMDDRTSDICRDLNGQIFRLDDETAPRPPQHWNCRSHIEPIVEPQEGRGGMTADLERAMRETGVTLDPEEVARVVREEIARGQAGVAERWFGAPAAGRIANGMSLSRVVALETGTMTLPQLRVRL